MINNWHLLGNSAQVIILEKEKEKGKEKRCRKTEEKVQTQLEGGKDT